ncbi:MAG: hypothetical protein NTX25_10600 [Proteobacteria bacterium]|nr:hypothetical protein [Pseudomonadota bacterium]
MPLLRDKQARNKLRRDLYEIMDKDGESIPVVVKTLRKMLGKVQLGFAE